LISLRLFVQIKEIGGRCLIEGDDDRRENEPVDIEIRDKKNDEERETTYTGQYGGGKEKTGIDLFHFSSK